MNCNQSQNHSLRRQASRAFTLIEMIGVLAVIAILAALLIPKVFSAISQARVNGVCISADTVKTALADHYGKYGKFDQVWGTNNITGYTSPLTSTVTNYDGLVLMTEGLLDKPFTVAIATSATIEICPGGSENGGAAYGYQLDGITNRTAGSQYVLEAVLYNVSAQDAKDLNDRIDGPSMGANSLQTRDNMGRVEYAAPVNGVVQNLYVYLTSR